MNNQNEQSVTITERKRISLSGVKEVESVTQEKIKLILCDNTQLLITGENLKLGAFSKQTQTITVDGKINELKYLAQKGGFIKKLLK